VPEPHHVQVVLGVELLLRREIRTAAVDVEVVAERVRLLAEPERLGVDGDDDQVLQQGLRLHARVEALQEQVHERAGSRERLVRERHYDGVVLHGGSAQQLHKLVFTGEQRSGLFISSISYRSSSIITTSNRKQKLKEAANRLAKRSTHHVKLICSWLAISSSFIAAAQYQCGRFFTGTRRRRRWQHRQKAGYGDACSDEDGQEISHAIHFER
jgi:hypothetical protein